MCMQLIHGLDRLLISSPYSLSLSLSVFFPLSLILVCYGMDPYHVFVRTTKIVNINASFLGGWKAITLSIECQILGFIMWIILVFVFIILQLYFCLDLAPPD